MAGLEGGSKKRGAPPEGGPPAPHLVLCLGLCLCCLWMALGPLDPNAGLQTLMDSYQEGGGFQYAPCREGRAVEKKGGGFSSWQWQRKKW